MRRAAGQGSTNAMFNLGFLYANGQGVAQDYTKAREWYEKAAAGQHERHAQPRHALRQWLGCGAGLRQGARVVREGRRPGSTNAMFNLGTLYDDGQGVAQDYAKAREWYQKAADRGDADAKARLEQMPIR